MRENDPKAYKHVLIFHQEMKFNSDDDSNSDEDEYSKEKSRRALQSSITRDSLQSSHEFSSAKKFLAPPKPDLSFDSDGDDDPGELAELMQNFVAPSANAMNSTSNTRGGGSGKGGGRAQAYKGQSSHTSSSIRFGAGGIRGIQHQSLSLSRDRECEADAGSVMSAVSTATSTAQHSIGGGASTSSKLMHIKPGQAIRVKAPSKKTRSAQQSDKGSYSGGGFTS